MKTITLNEAFRILQNASSVILDGFTASLSLDTLTGNPDNQFAQITWEDDEGLAYSVTFSEGNNQDIAPQVKGGVLLLTDDEGEPTEITILMPANLEAIEQPAPISEAEETKRGQTLVDLLNLKEAKITIARRGAESYNTPRYVTAWGTKTALGLFRTVQAVINGEFPRA